jgi:hypothetical protein
MTNAGRDEVSPGVRLFPYHRAVAPMMWVLLCLVGIEAAVTHGLIALWNGRVALVLSAISLGIAMWLVRFILSFKTRPVRLTSRELVWPAGHLRAVAVPITQVRARCEDWTLAAIRKEGAFNAATIAHPNIVLELDPPVRQGRRTIRYLAHRLDDPQAFNAALDALLGRHD